MSGFLRSLFTRRDSPPREIENINALRVELAPLSDADLRIYAGKAGSREEVIAAAAVAASRVLGQEMFDVQLRGALALTEGMPSLPAQDPRDPEDLDIPPESEQNPRGAGDPRIAEMQTGEGKTLVAVPAAVWYAKAGKGVHVMTVNDYLARRDANWMRGIYEYFGLSVGYIQREMTTADRKQAYACDVTYATANEVGFDFLRDQLAWHAEEQVLRPFAAALIDEADSILIDEARIPLVIAGGDSAIESLPYRVDAVTRRFRRGVHFTVDEHGRNVALTDFGAKKAEQALGCDNLYEPENINLLCAVQDSLQAHALLRRDVDYLVKDGAIASVDEFKGRVIQDRRWPAGLHSAIEAKEGVALKKQGQVLGSITLQNLVALYPHVCGMTGTAATQALEFKEIYGLEVEVIPTNRPVIRVDHPDKVFANKRDKEEAVIDEIFATHSSGRPVLVGTCSVEESEGLSRRLREAGIPHHVLNARNEEEEAAIVARAGQRGAVTISTNMAGRGTDIQLGPGVAELGGLYVIGTNRHESRRIDHQLRGRAGRQGDPGSSRFFISMEDDLMQRYAGEGALSIRDPEAIQRVAEGQNLAIRRFLNKYEGVIEAQRQIVQRWRQEILMGNRSEEFAADALSVGPSFGNFPEPEDEMESEDRIEPEDQIESEPEMESDPETESEAEIEPEPEIEPDGGSEVALYSPDEPMSETERLVRLTTIDDLWSDYLAEIADYRAGIHLVSWSRDPLHEYLVTVDRAFTRLKRKIEKESLRRLAKAMSTGVLPRQRGTTWTYLTTDQPFGSETARILRGLVRMVGLKAL